MDFRPTDAQQLLAHSARDFLARRCPIEAAPDGSGEKASLWPEMAELGWPGLLIPSDLGGSDGTLLDVVLLVEEMGRSALQSPYVGSAVAGTSLLLRGLRGAKRVAVLSDMALGRRISTLALLETTGELDADALRARGEPGGAIDGCKLFARDVDIADDLIVAARGARGISLFHVERSRPGVTYRPMPSMDGERLFDVKLDAVAVSPDDLIGAEGAGWPLLIPAIECGALARAAEMIGAAQRILELAVLHAKTRVQSGRPIGSFQAIQHACADLLRGVETARPLAWSAAWKIDAGLPAAADVAMAKHYAGDACLAVARRAHQIFGAIGYCDEHPLHRLHKRILAARQDCGDAVYHAEIVARAIGLE